MCIGSNIVILGIFLGSSLGVWHTRSQDPVAIDGEQSAGSPTHLHPHSQKRIATGFAANEVARSVNSEKPP